MAASALIIAGPGPLRDGLRALVGTMPQVEAVSVASNVQGFANIDLQTQPNLVLLDVSAAPGVWLTIRRIKARWPGSRIIVLANTVEQQGEAVAAGADAVLLEGLPAARIIAVIVKLLPWPAV
jgi:DNA-binding NarL/FixJ family response regulator